VLFARHRDRLWAVALRTTGNPEDAADALQEAMIAAFRRAESFRGDAAVTTWLHRIVVNACLDRLRRRKVRLAEPLPDDLEEQLGRGSAATAAPPADDPAEVAEKDDDRRLVLAALDTLPAEQRAALVLVDMQGYSVAEAAELLEVATGTVKSRCSRARARLLPLLAPLRQGGNPDASRRVPSATPTNDPRMPSAAPRPPTRHGGDQP
jgi:RNA polymerase sigma-70 factor (ECF subfamily)